ncbi:MAG: 16S rRNA (guanine(966)-N(2))-methyltransferase RsmD [Chloroflexi bacterium]|nr:16S rRNA (guanine(966)-N(2))-methyltransferase RsmD [Chloroflexota bacterium]
MVYSFVIEAMRVVAGEARGRRIGTLRNLGARPTTSRVRSALFSILESVGLEDKRVVDLYAGTGSLGIEALSRGALWADFVEANPRRCSLLRKTLSALGFSDRAGVHCMKVERAIDVLDKSYDFVLMDPPYTLGPPHDVIKRLRSLAVNGALVAVGHSRHHSLEPSYDGLVLIRERQYGDTVFTLYREGGDQC